MVLGCAQNALFDQVVQRAGGRLQCVRREAGGGAVLTGPWLVSASVVLPMAHDWVRNGLIDSYRALGQMHAAALQEYGVAARALSPEDLAQSLAHRPAQAPRWACFGGLSHWEVVDPDGRKLVGLAQRRRRHGVLLVAGTLIGPVPWQLLCDAMGQSQDAALLARSTVSVEEILARPCPAQAFAATLRTHLQRLLPDA